MVRVDRREPVANGYQDWVVGLNGVELMRGAVFGAPSADFILLMRLLRKPPEADAAPHADG